MSTQRVTKQRKSLPAAGIALLATLFFASCSQDDSLNSSNAGSLPALGVSTVQATDIDVSKLSTRAATTTDYPTSKSIGFFVKADAANGYKAVDNRKGTYDTTRKQWLPVADTPVDSIWLNSYDADIAVYAPYDATHTTAATLNLAAGLRPADGSKDIWCKHFTANNASKNLTVTLEHVYTRLVVVVSRDANYKADATLSAFDLKGDEVYQTATYKPFETALYIYSSTTGLTPTVTTQTLNASTASTTYDLLLIPATLTGDLILTLSVDGKKMQVKIIKDKFTGNKLEAGKQYNVNLALKPGKLDVTSVSVVKWDALTEVSGGQGEFDEPIAGIDIGLPFLIAPGNLIATPYVGDGGGHMYDVAEEQGYYSNDIAGGDYFCWNTLDPSLLNVIQPFWNEALDPCRQLEHGEWYTPTNDQLHMLINTDNVWGEKIYAMADGTTVNGRYFGTKTVPDPSKQDNYVFLPAAGFRNNDGTINQVGGDGDFWSRTPIASGGYYLGFRRNSYINTHTPDRAYGLTVRCIKDKPKVIST